MSHTPGPWVWRFYGRDDDWVRDPKGEAVVQVGYNAYEREENARLIAAAPELLAALKAARNIIGEFCESDDFHQKHCVALDAVIAKAEGRV